MPGWMESISVANVVSRGGHKEQTDIFIIFHKKNQRNVANSTYSVLELHFKFKAKNEIE